MSYVHCKFSSFLFYFLPIKLFIFLWSSQFSYSSWYPPEEDVPEISILLFILRRRIIYPRRLSSPFSFGHKIVTNTVYSYRKSPFMVKFVAVELVAITWFHDIRIRVGLNLPPQLSVLGPWVSSE